VKLPLVHNRRTDIKRDYRAGCLVCYGEKARWTSANAQAVAAQHHDRTGHATWCDKVEQISYGRHEPDDRQHDLEDAIAASRSGGEPDATPLTDFDAPAVPTADVSAPVGRSSKHALAAAKPEHHHV
jgi:hypothetical protein